MLEFHYILTVERIIHKTTIVITTAHINPKFTIFVVSIDCPPAPTTTVAPTPGCLICPVGRECLIIGFSQHDVVPTYLDWYKTVQAKPINTTSHINPTFTIFVVSIAPQLWRPRLPPRQVVWYIPRFIKVLEPVSRSIFFTSHTCWLACKWFFKQSS